MTKIQRSKERIDQTGEVFTPAPLVNEILDHLPEDIWQDKSKTWLDPTCGEGAFLIEVQKRLLQHHSKEHILQNMIFGADIMPDNVEITILHLYGSGNITEVPSSETPKEYKVKGFKSLYRHNGKIVPNIVCADGLEYDYSFGRSADMPECLSGLFTKKK
jgi:hypothetical protein